MDKTFERLVELAEIIFDDNGVNQEACDKRLTRVTEEVGELAGAIRSYFGRKNRTDHNPSTLDDVYDELGDVISILYAFCYTFGTTPEACVNRTLKKWLTRRLEVIEENKRALLRISEQIEREKPSHNDRLAHPDIAALKGILTAKQVAAVYKDGWQNIYKIWEDHGDNRQD